MHYQNERNYGCRVSDDWSFRNNKVAIIENELIRVVVLVDKGADIYSFVHKPSDTDYMWRTVWGVRDTTKFLATTGESPWMDTYEGGWQSCAPTARCWQTSATRRTSRCWLRSRPFRCGRRRRSSAKGSRRIRTRCPTSSCSRRSWSAWRSRASRSRCGILPVGRS